MALRRYSPFVPGTIFLRSGDDNHWWVVLSDPAKDQDQVVVVNWTTLEAYKEQTCILEIGEHICITRRCCIYYIGATVERLSRLQFAEVSERVEVKGMLDPAILQRIREGATRSENMPNVCLAVLEAQGLV
jgi:hypothetical protein